MVVAIVGLLAMLAAMSLKPSVQMAKARDSKRKTDLKVITISLEDYLGDHPCYPEVSMMECTPGDGLRPYLAKIPCDPQTKKSYTYIRPDDCSQFVIYAKLETEKEMKYGAYNYALSSSNLRVLPTVEPTPTAAPPAPTDIPIPTPTSPPYIGPYGCFSGECKPLFEFDCDPKYDRSECRGRCYVDGEVSNECQ